MTWLKKVKRSIRSDELMGKWHTEDGTGFNIMMGSWIEFGRNGNGRFESWARGDHGYEYSNDFKWKRISDNKIVIQQVGKPKKEEISYKIEIINNREELSNQLLRQNGEAVDEFWNFSQIMFRSSIK